MSEDFENQGVPSELTPEDQHENLIDENKENNTGEEVAVPVEEAVVIETGDEYSGDDALEKEIHNQKIQIATLEAEKKALADELGEKDFAIRALEETKSKLEARFTNLETGVEKYAGQEIKEREADNARITFLEEQLALYRKQNDELITKQDESAEKITKYELQIQEISQERDKIQKQSEYFEAQVKSLEDSHKLLHENLTNRYASAEARVRALEEEQDQFKKSEKPNGAINGDNSDVNNGVDSELATKFKALSEAFSRQEQEYTRRLQGMEAKGERRKNKSKILKAQISTLEAEVGTLKTQLSTLCEIKGDLLQEIDKDNYSIYKFQEGEQSKKEEIAKLNKIIADGEAKIKTLTQKLNNELAAKSNISSELEGTKAHLRVKEEEIKRLQNQKANSDISALRSKEARVVELEKIESDLKGQLTTLQKELHYQHSAIVPANNWGRVLFPSVLSFGIGAGAVFNYFKFSDKK